MVFLFDENVPYKFVEGLSSLESANNKSKIKATVFHPKHYQKESASDEEIIELAGSLNAVIVTFDKDFKHLKKYAALFNKHNVGVIFLKMSRGEENYWGIVKLIITKWEEMKHYVYRLQKPYIVKVEKTGISKLPLIYRHDAHLVYSYQFFEASILSY